jgi:hypothetical protein
MSSENGKSLLLYYNRTFSVPESSTLQLPEDPTIHASNLLVHISIIPHALMSNWSLDSNSYMDKHG